MRYLFGILLVVLLGFTDEAHAVGVYLQMLHNNSNANVIINARVPPGWVGVPKYPYKVKPHHSLYDEKFYDRAYWKLSRHKVSNVAIPPGGTCSKDTYLSIVVGETHHYRLHDCDWTIHVEKKIGSRWEPFSSARQKKGVVKIKNTPVFYWAAFIEPNGDLVVTDYREDLKSGDSYREADR